MTTSRIRAPRWWAFPVALCVLVTVGCSTVDGSTTGAGSGPTAPSLPTTASSVPDQPGTTSTDGSDVEPAGTEPAATEPPGSTSADSEPPVGTPDPSSPPVTSSGPSTAPVRMLSIDRFQSPTRNIGCLIDQGTYVRCDLGESAITEKHDCQGVGDWGQAVALTAGRAAGMICASDTVKDAAAPVLPYGSSTKVGSITCTSNEDGMHCGDGAGHGFWLSRSRYVVS